MPFSIIPRRPLIMTAMLFLLAAVGGCASGDQRSACEALTSVKIDSAVSIKADYVTAGYRLTPLTALVGLPWFKVPDSCRVTIVLSPSPDSHIVSKVWLPRAAWNSRLWSIGNGGLGGGIDDLPMTIALSRGYAVSGTDTGHDADGKEGSWALGHREKIVDYGYRSIHLTALAAKALMKAYYGRPAAHSYFNGGSNGGRQALMEAQRFPEDYDGIVAGAPAYRGTNNIGTMAWIAHRYLAKPESWIDPDKLPAIAAAAMKECDARDGVSDGLIEDPRQCRFDPAVLLCKGAENDGCLTRPQVETLRAIYEGPDGKGYAPGGELGWKEWITGSKPGESMGADFAQEFYRFLIYGNRDWPIASFDYAHDRDAAARRLGPVYNATDPDLSRFAAHGGKLILYHGWNDPALSPLLTVDYFESIQKVMGAGKAAGFVRLYMVPGLEHVFLGPGPNAFGHIAAPASDADPRLDLSAALEQWVEKGVAPGAIIAGKYKNDVKALVEPRGMTPLRTRPLCPYPQVAYWTGGSIDKAENFTCTAQPH